MPGREIYNGFYNKSVWTPQIYQIGYLSNIICFILTIAIRQPQIQSSCRNSYFSITMSMPTRFKRRGNIDTAVPDNCFTDLTFFWIFVGFINDDEWVKALSSLLPYTKTFNLTISCLQLYNIRREFRLYFLTKINNSYGH